MDWRGDMADKIGTGECGEILIFHYFVEIEKRE
jgi:hypothetical protein